MERERRRNERDSEWASSSSDRRSRDSDRHGRDRDHSRDSRDDWDRDRERRYRDDYDSHSRRRRDRSGRDRERDSRRRRDRSRSSSPSVFRARLRYSKVSDEDLANVIPINERVRKQSFWDVARKGFEKVPAELAKRSGYFNLRGDTKPPREDLLRGLVDPAILSQIAVPSINPRGRPGNMVVVNPNFGNNNYNNQNNYNNNNNNNFGNSRFSNNNNNNNNGFAYNNNNNQNQMNRGVNNSVTTETEDQANLYDTRLSPKNSRAARRVIISGFKNDESNSVTPEAITEYLTEALGSIRLVKTTKDVEVKNEEANKQPGTASVTTALSTTSVKKVFVPSVDQVVLDCQFSKDGNKIIVELASGELATLAITFNNSPFQGISGQWIMNIRRPGDYIIPEPINAEIEENHVLSVRQTLEKRQEIEAMLQEKKSRKKDEQQEQQEQQEEEEEEDEYSGVDNSTKEKLETVDCRVIDSKDKLYVADLPFYLTRPQILELFLAFGDVEALEIVQDRDQQYPPPWGETRGIAFVQYKRKKNVSNNNNNNEEDESSLNDESNDVTMQAMRKLNGMTLGNDNVLRCGLACVGRESGLASLPLEMAGFSQLVNKVKNGDHPNRFNNEEEAGIYHDSPVLELLNMVSPEELLDDKEYKEIKEDIQQECCKYGQVVDVVVPRPNDSMNLSTFSNTNNNNNSNNNNGTIDKKVNESNNNKKSLEELGIGKVYVKFDSLQSCQAAFKGLGGRQFNGRTVISTFFPEDNFNLGIY